MFLIIDFTGGPPLTNSLVSGNRGNTLISTMLIYQIVQNFPTTQNGALLNRMPQYNNTAHLTSYKSIQSAIKKKGTLQKDGLS